MNLKPLRAVPFGLAALQLASCAATNLPPITSYGGRFEPLPDEQRVWDEARLEERTLREHIELYEDPEFAAYAAQVLDRLVPPGSPSERSPDYRVALIQDPTANAFSYPHGSIYLHTGLLSKVTSEAQLAALLAHEIQHVERRHTVRKVRQEKNERRRWVVVGVAATAVLIALDIDAIEDGDWQRHLVFGTLAEAFVEVGFDALRFAAMESIEGYGQTMEWEADEGAFARLAAAGYDVDEAARVFDLLLEGAIAPGETQTFFYASQPWLETRRRQIEAWVAARPSAAAASFSPVADQAQLGAHLARLRQLQDQLGAKLAASASESE